MNNEWQYHLVKGISWLVCRLPYKLILLIGASLGPVYGLLAKKQKLRGIKNIKIGMNMNNQEAEQLIDKLFKNLGRSVMEVLYMPNLTKSFIDEHIEMRGVEYLEEANKVLGSPLVREANGEDLLRRPEMTYDILTSLTPYKPAMEDREAVEQVEIAIKYQGYIEHQQEEIEKQKRHENTAIPANFDYSKVSGLSNEVRAKLEQHRPVSIGQASRISGITPAAISIILVNLKKQGMLKRGE